MLEFIFQSFWTFIGCLTLIIALGHYCIYIPFAHLLIMNANKCKTEIRLGETNGD